jgi:hypothetical protein
MPSTSRFDKLKARRFDKLKARRFDKLKALSTPRGSGREPAERAADYRKPQPGVPGKNRC